MVVADLVRRVLHDAVAVLRDDTVSSAWLRYQERREERIDFPGPGIRWPMNQPHDHDGWMNRFRLRTDRETAA